MNKEFESFKAPDDTIWFTPEVHTVRFCLTPPDLTGTELVAMLFNDAHVGPVALALHPNFVPIVQKGLQSILDNEDYLRSGNAELRNQKKENNDD